MCYLCDQEKLLATYGINAAQLAAKIHYQQATTALIPDGIGGDLKIPQYSALLVATADTVPGDATSTATLTVDAPSIVSTIDTVGDQDFYKVELVAGQVYDFGLYGKVGGPSLTPLSDSYIELYDASGTLITSADGGADTPLNSANDGFDALLTYVAQASGTYYMNARAFDNVPADGSNGDLVGDYEIFVRNVTDEPRYIPYYDADSPLYAIDWGTRVNKVNQSSANPDGDEGTRATGNAQGTPIYASTVDIPGLAAAQGVDITGKNVITIYFAKAGDVFTSNDPTNPGLPPATITATGVQEFERTAVTTALAEFAKVADVVYLEVQDRTQADFVYTSYIGTPGPGVSLLGSMSPPDESDEGLAQFNSGDYRWNATDLAQGGFSFVTLIHEFGHGHGLAHPHDNGGHSGVMGGVEAEGAGVADYTTGDFHLNQAVFTMMSYEDGWVDSPYGNAPTDVGYGYLGGLMAFDIAAIQDKYGVNEDYAAGDDVYTLKDVNAAGTFYSSIWDGGGHDTIRYDGARDANIDLRAATLEYEGGGGGRVSYAYGIFGGYTVANGVTIEDAIGGSGNDRLIGNDAANRLSGGGGGDIVTGGRGRDLLEGGDGADTLSGSAGRDMLIGGTGVDRLIGGGGGDRFVFATGDTGSSRATADRIIGFSHAEGDRIDLSRIDADRSTTGDDAFSFIGTATFSGTAGELRVVLINDRFLVVGDTDGDKRADFMILGNGDTPVITDFNL